MHACRSTLEDPTQDLPFERLVEELKPERSFGQNPFFQMMFIYQKLAAGPEFPGLELREAALETRTSKFDITLSVLESPDGLRATFEYDADLFDRASMERMAGHFESLARAIADRPELAIARHDILTAAERRLLLGDWNDTAVELPREACLHQLIEQQVRRSPDAVALVFDDSTLTYRELDTRANRVARTLRERGVGPGTLVGICVERSLEMVVGLFAILKAGGAYVPLDPAYPRDRLVFMMEDSGVEVLLTQRALGAGLSHRAVEIFLDDEDLHRESGPAGAGSGQDACAADLAYVIYTSGSTGKPKGVQIPHRAVVNFLNAMRAAPGLTERDTLLSVTTLSFDIAALELFLPLATGGRVVLASRAASADGAALGALMARHRVTTMQATPVTWRLLLDSGWTGDAGLRVLCGGEAMPAQLARELLPRCGELWNMYGPTETTIWSMIARVRPGPEAIPIGRPIDNTTAYIVDRHLNPVPIGVPGELLIGGVGLARGYWRRPELTAEKFVPDPFRPGETVYRTGDLCRWRPDATIECLGRLDHQVKIRGFRIEPGEIESVLLQHPQIGAAVVLMREDTPGDKRLVGYGVAKNGPAPSVSELRELLRARLPEYMVPAAIVMLGQLPLTPNGKVDRKALPAPAPDRSDVGPELVLPRTDVERMLASIWKDLLGLDRVGVHDHFFDVGGHSLLAVRLFARIQQASGIQLPVAVLIQAPTIEKLALALGKHRECGAGPLLVPLQPRGGRPPIFWIHTLGGGGGGGIFRYGQLAEKLHPDQPSYGLQAPDEPYTVMETMAEHYIRAIKQVQPAGPYHLIGYCFGGNVAFEMARQLREAGEEVAFLGLLDASAESVTSWTRETLGIFLGNVANWLRSLVRTTPAQHVRQLRLATSRMLAYLRRRAQGLREIPALDEMIGVVDYPPEFLRHATVHWNALGTYHPGPYDGSAVLFRSRLHGLFDLDPRRGWGALVRGQLEVQESAPTHAEILEEPYLTRLARALSTRLDASLAGRTIGPADRARRIA